MTLEKPNMLVMFAFEFTILMISCAGVCGRYALALLEKVITTRKTNALRERRRRVLRRRVQRGEISEEEMADLIIEEEETGDVVGAWEGKSVWVFYLEIVTGEFPRKYH